jgi:hypothetical protein
MIGLSCLELTDGSRRIRRVDDDRPRHRADRLHGLHRLGPGEKSKAGRFGTLILFFVLGLGVLAFIIKSVVVGFLEGV